MLDLPCYSGFVFVVDTTEYSGNFEREMTAFCTGAMDEGEYARKDANRFCEEAPSAVREYMRRHTIMSWVEDHGWMTPATIWATPGYWNNGHGTEFPDSEWDGKQRKWPAYLSVGMLFDEAPTDEILDFLKGRARKFKKRNYLGTREPLPVDITGFRLLQVKLGSTVEERHV